MMFDPGAVMQGLRSAYCGSSEDQSTLGPVHHARGSFVREYETASAPKTRVMTSTKALSDGFTGSKTVHAFSMFSYFQDGVPLLQLLDGNLFRYSQLRLVS